MLTTHDSFLRTLFGSFFRGWWAVLTGFASILSWIYAPASVTLSRGQVASATLLGLLLMFFAVSTIYQGWQLFKNRITPSSLVGFLKSDNYGGEFVFIIKGVHDSSRGKVAELKRTVNGVEVSFAIVEFMDFTSQGYFQASPVWISPNHLRELRTGKFAISDVVVDPLITCRTLLTARIGSTV
jgi:hypothetical protein